jgi:hypothetical protein
MGDIPLLPVFPLFPPCKIKKFMIQNYCLLFIVHDKNAGAEKNRLLQKKTVIRN